jgi:hypothetical protein
LLSVSAGNVSTVEINTNNTVMTSDTKLNARACRHYDA